MPILSPKEYFSNLPIKAAYWEQRFRYGIGRVWIEAEDGTIVVVQNEMKQLVGQHGEVGDITFDTVQDRPRLRDGKEVQFSKGARVGLYSSRHPNSQEKLVGGLVVSGDGNCSTIFIFVSEQPELLVILTSEFAGHFPGLEQSFFDYEAEFP